jgi:antitoxin (DNA-binding transcriptional repressor) of toxin-antitoxin stability system
MTPLRQARVRSRAFATTRTLEADVDLGAMWTHDVHMKTATVRDLRNNFAKLEAWLGNGEQVCIEKRGEPVAMLTALPRARSKNVKRPDFAARRRAIWGDRVFSEAEVKTMREYELEGEEG